MLFQLTDREGFLIVEAETGRIEHIKRDHPERPQSYVKCLAPDEAVKAFSSSFRCPFYASVPIASGVLRNRPFCLLVEQWIDSRETFRYVCGGNWKTCSKIKQKGLL